MSELLFESRVVDVSSSIQRVVSESLSDGARVGFVYMLATLAHAGEKVPVTVLEKSSCAVTSAIAKLASVALYPGESEEARTMAHVVIRDVELRDRLERSLDLQ